MQLPKRTDGRGVEIGISDILAWRDCATRAKVGRRRHEQGEAPESWSPENAYGSAIHLCLAMLDDGATPDEAAQAAFAQFGQWLEPSDLSRLQDDMRKYLEREMVGVRTLLNEGEISVPLFEHPLAGPVWFRARIDRLYQSLEDPTRLIHLDYKSSKWAKSRVEVDADLQLWSYNLAIFEWFCDLYPEFEPAQVRIQQLYDQLMYGQVPTQKGPEQRLEIRRWLIAAITAMIADEDEAPSYNEWCPWCSLKMDCPVVQFELTDWAVTKISALMPREEKLNKDGSVSKRLGKVSLDSERIREYVELLPQVKRAGQVLEAFAKEVNSTLKRMPESELHRLGKQTRDRSQRVFTVEAKREIIEAIGLPTFLMLCDVSLAEVERFFVEEKEMRERIVALAEKERGYTIVEDL